MHEDASFTLETTEHTIKAKAIIIASGGGMFIPRKPPLQDLELFEEKSVFYAVKNKAQFKDQDIVIAGGGDSAADWAVELSGIAKHIHLIHRRAQFRAAEETVKQVEELIEQGKITLHTPYQLKGIHGENGITESVTIADLDGVTKTISANSLLCFFGLAPSQGHIADWGLNMNGKKVTVNPETMSTNIQGITAVGDIADYPAKLGLILTGFAESAIALKTIQHHINPEKKFKVVYSTSKGIPNA